MNVLQSCVITLMGWTLMTVIFEDIVDKKTKKFIFKVQQTIDGSYTVTQQALRVFPDGGTSLKDEKKWNYANLQELKNGEYKKSRQGKQFLESQFWMDK